MIYYEKMHTIYINITAHYNQSQLSYIIKCTMTNTDTNGVEESVLYREVSSLQGLKCMQE